MSDLNCVEKWSVEDLAIKLEVDDDLLLKKSTFWINNHVLQRSSCGTFLFATTNFTEYSKSSNMEITQDEVETGVSLEAQRAAEQHVFESYIVGMLANYGTLKIERIHTMLLTFSRSGSETCTFVYLNILNIFEFELDDKSIPELAALLRVLVSQEKVEYIGGEYQLNSKTKG